jgi:hypothetical protein
MKADRPDCVFTTHQYSLDVIEVDLEGWFETVRARVNMGFRPSESVVLDVPKPHWLVRPAHVITLEDGLVYKTLLGAFHAPITDEAEQHVLLAAKRARCNTLSPGSVAGRRKLRLRGRRPGGSPTRAISGWGFRIDEVDQSSPTPTLPRR